MSDENSEKKDFVVKDRRFSTQTDEDSSDDTSKDPGMETQKERPEERQTADEPEKETSDAPKAEESELPAINFMTFIMSLNASAMVNLGIIEDPATGQKTKNMALGKQTIDILGMLEEKTKGNLNNDEEHMLKNILYDLRIIYVKEKA